MIRSLWLIITTLALANLLALFGFVGWLGSTERLSLDRVEQVRLVFKDTLQAEKTRREREARELEKLEEEKRAQDRIGLPPVTADQRVSIMEEYGDVVELRTQQLQRQTLDLIRATTQEREKLDKERAAFQAERKAFFDMRDELTQLQSDEQFGKTVALYQSLKPEQARSLMQTLIDQGQTLRVVAYLNAIQPRTASKIIAAFEAEDPTLAADLLERLRTLGIEARAEKAVPND